MIGYVQLYFKVVGKNDTYYASFDMDFSKPLTRLRLNGLKRSIKRAYERFDKICSVKFCSKEEWEEHHYDDDISINWGSYNNAFAGSSHKEGT